MDNSISWNPEFYNTRHNYVFDYGEDLLQLLAPKQDELILDLGCGAGQLTAKIHEASNQAFGIDKSPEMVAKARNSYPNISFTVGDAASFSLPDQVAAIFSNAALHWVLDYKQAIQQMYQALLPNGRVVLEFGGVGNVASIISSLRSSIKSHGFKEQAERKLWYFPSIGSYTSALEAAGFHVKQAYHFERPTALADAETGIIDWLSMFADGFFQGVPTSKADKIKYEVQERLRSSHFVDNKWYVDYKRIRIVAIKSA